MPDPGRIRGHGGRRGLAALAALSALSCAKIEPPPGGPPDHDPPVLLATRPESTAVYPGLDGSVEFYFNEVVSEGSQPSQGLGTSDLERLILLSPSRDIPRISWKRDHISVRPKEGWQPDRVYRVQLLPGITDLSRNRSSTGAVITFSTGAPLPADTLSGVLVDWTTSQPARLGLVIAVLLPDSLPYKAMTDSSGRYSVGPLPAGRYLVYGAVDQNRNLKIDGREGWDSAGVNADSGSVAVLWAFPHDTVGPRIQSVTEKDSLTIEVTFTQVLDPGQRLDSSSVRIQRSDSTSIPVVSVLQPLLDDTVQAALRRAADSAAAAADTSRPRPDTTRPAPPRPARPAGRPGQPGTPAAGPDSALAAILAQRPTLATRLIIRLASPLVPESRIAVEVLGIRNANGVAGDARGGMTIPKRREPPPAPDDSAAAVPDSAARDSTAPAKPQ